LFGLRRLVAALPAWVTCHPSRAASSGAFPVGASEGRVTRVPTHPRHTQQVYHPPHHARRRRVACGKRWRVIALQRCGAYASNLRTAWLHPRCSFSPGGKRQDDGERHTILNLWPLSLAIHHAWRPGFW